MRVFCIETSTDYWVEAIRRLMKEDGWEPVYWTGHTTREKAVREAAPKAIYHDTFEAMRGILPDGFPFPLIPLSPSFIEEVALEEQMVLRMMQRMDLCGTFSHDARLQLYYDHLRHALTLLERLRPDLVVFPYVPHLCFDYVIYRLCRKRGIPTLCIHDMCFPDRLPPIAAFEEEAGIQRRYEELLTRGEAPGLSGDGEAYFQRTMSADYHQAKPFYMNNKKFFDSFEPSWRRELAFGLQYAKDLLTILKDWFKPAYRHYFKEPGRSIKESKWTLGPLELARLRSKFPKRELLKAYEKRMVKADLSKPYIYVPLHMQPEMSSIPMGGPFLDQRLLVDMLARSVPDGWMVYVREHPAQFFPRGYGELWRSEEDYAGMLSHPNVRLVSLHDSAWDLTDHARAVATLTGTAGWEALVRGRPVLLFGYAWYRGCDGAMFIRTQDDLNEALDKVVKGILPDWGKVKLFYKAMTEVCPRGYSIPERAKPSGVSYEENVRAAMKVLRGAAANATAGKGA